MDLEHLYTAPAFDSSMGQTPQNLGLSRCRSCLLVCTTGAKSAAVEESYSPEYYGSAASKFLTIIETALYWIKARQARKITQLWQRGLLAEGAPSVLDIGCGRGQLLAAFHAGGATVLGLERQEFPLQDLHGTMVRSGSLADPEYAGTTFDIIILWHVLEHLELQAQLLDVITEHLNADGLLIIAVPNFASLQQRLFGKYWFHLDLPRHLVHLESNWLQNQLQQRGYAIEAVSYLDSLQNTYGFIQSAMNALVPLRLNEYYRLLKHGRARNPMAILRMLGWSMLALLLLPFAVLDNLWGKLLRNGATVQIAARNKSMR